MLRVTGDGTNPSPRFLSLAFARLLFYLCLFLLTAHPILASFISRPPPSVPLEEKMTV